MYQNYIFDFYGTLADIRTNESKPYLWKKMSEFYTAQGAAYAPASLRAEFRRLEKEAARLQAAKLPGMHCGADMGATMDVGDAEPDLTEVFAELYRRKGVACDRKLASMMAIMFRTLSRSFVRAYDGVEELLGELKVRGKGVYLLSNAQTDFTRPEIKMLGLTGYFDGIFISSEQGVKKPSPLFFKRLLQEFSLDPKTCIMVGNDEAADIAGAKAVGMDCLYIHTAISPEEYGNIEPTYRVMDGDFRKAAEILLQE